jgi:hypothetical protein
MARSRACCVSSASKGGSPICRYQRLSLLRYAADEPRPSSGRASHRPAPLTVALRVTLERQSAPTLSPHARTATVWICQGRNRQVM